MTQEKDTKPIVFFSWQSDISAKTNRNVISDCLRDICKKNNLSFDEATKNRCGSPDIASTIEEKIRSADIFIADAQIIMLQKMLRMLHCNNYGIFRNIFSIS